MLNSENYSRKVHARRGQMTGAERDRPAVIMARVLADPDAVMRFVDGNEGCYRGTPLLQAPTGGAAPSASIASMKTGTIAA